MTSVPLIRLFVVTELESGSRLSQGLRFALSPRCFCLTLQISCHSIGREASKHMSDFKLATAAAAASSTCGAPSPARAHLVRPSDEPSISIGRPKCVERLASRRKLQASERRLTRQRCSVGLISARKPRKLADSAGGRTRRSSLETPDWPWTGSTQQPTINSAGKSSVGFGGVVIVSCIDWMPESVVHM